MSKRCGDWTPQDTRNGIESKQKENWKLGCDDDDDDDTFIKVSNCNSGI